MWTHNKMQRKCSVSAVGLATEVGVIYGANNSLL